MQATKLFLAIATVAVAGSAFAADVPAANATVTSAASAAQVTAAAKSVSVPAAQVAKTTRTRAEVRAEAIEAVKHHRATEASQYDWINN